MVVEIKEDIFSGRDFKGLNFLIQILTYKQRYGLFVDIPLIKKTELYNKLDEDDKKEIEENFNKIINEGLVTNYYVSTECIDNQFNIEEAIRYFSQPISIILENSLNDQYFVNAIIKNFDKKGDLKKHLENSWIQFENAGGCSNVENFIKGKLQSFNNLHLKYAKPNHKYLRCFVLLDSDKEFPSSGKKPAYIKLEPFLDANGVKKHILAKRCMENYMPDDVYDAIANTPQLIRWVNVYKHPSFSETQKDYLNIHDGFPKQVEVKKKSGRQTRREKQGKTHTHKKRERRDELELGVKSLFASVSDTNFAILDLGFKFPNFKTEFPKRFESIEVYKKSMEARAGSNELQEILDKITELL